MHCVYVIRNILNDKRYVGYSSCPEERWKEHIRLLKKSNPPCHIHRAIAKDGLAVFEFRIIETFETKEDGLLAEIKWISEFDSYGDNGYNETRGGDGNSHIWTPEQKKAQSVRIKKLYESFEISHETRKKLRNVWLGRQHSEESKLLMAEKARGKKHTLETRAKMSEKAKGRTSPNKGKVMTEEQKRKISETKRKNGKREEL